MNAITHDKYLKFVIDNYPDIQALNELLDYARKNLPPLVGQEIVEAILELEDSYFHERGLYVTSEKDAQEIWWSDPSIYDRKADTGPWFGFEYNLTWSDIEESDPEKVTSLFLYVNVESIKGRRSQTAYIDRWVASLRAHKTKLRKSGILPRFDDEAFDYDDPWPVYYPLHREISLETIANREEFRQGIQAAVKRFTSALLPILREGNPS